MKFSVLSRIALGFAIASVGLTAMATSAVARPLYSWQKYYYYDAAHTQYAGDEELLCSGTRYLEGVKTNYYVVVWEEQCYDPPCNAGSGYCS